MNKSRSGFTIVELLIVIVIIGILAAITIVAYRGIQQRATTANYTATVDRWEKILRMEATLQGDDMPSGLRISCLGSSIADFPETADFQEGECIAGGQMSYEELAFEGWKSQRPQVDLPVVKVTTDGETMLVRGIFFLSISSGLTGLNEAQMGIYWYPQVAGECGRGVDSSIDPKETGNLTGGACKITVRGIK